MKNTNLERLINDVSSIRRTQNTEVLMNNFRKRGVRNNSMEDSTTMLGGIQTLANELMTSNSGMTYSEINKDITKIDTAIRDIDIISSKISPEKIQAMDASLRAIAKLAKDNRPDTKRLLDDLCDGDTRMADDITRAATDTVLPLQFLLFELSYMNETLVALLKIFAERAGSNLDDMTMVDVYKELCNQMYNHKDDNEMRKLVENNMQDFIVKQFDDDETLYDKLEKVKASQFTYSKFKSSDNIASGKTLYQNDFERFYGRSIDSRRGDTSYDDRRGRDYRDDRGGRYNDRRDSRNDTRQDNYANDRRSYGEYRTDQRQTYNDNVRRDRDYRDTDRRYGDRQDSRQDDRSRDRRYYDDNRRDDRRDYRDQRDNYQKDNRYDNRDTRDRESRYYDDNRRGRDDRHDDRRSGRDDRRNDEYNRDMNNRERRTSNRYVTDNDDRRIDSIMNNRSLSVL